MDGGRISPAGPDLCGADQLDQKALKLGSNTACSCHDDPARLSHSMTCACISSGVRPVQIQLRTIVQPNVREQLQRELLLLRHRDAGDICS